MGRLNVNPQLNASVSGAPAGFVDQCYQACTTISNTFINDITVNISVGWGEIGGSAIPPGATYALGGVSGGEVPSYSTIRSLLQSRNNPGVAAVKAAAALPAGSSLNGSGTFFLPTAGQRALGRIGAGDPSVDGQIGFGTGWTSNWVGGFLHELTHAMGRVDGTIFDMWKFSAPGVWNFGTGSGLYFSIDQGVTKLANFGFASDPGDFLNDSLLGADAFGETVNSTSWSALDITTMNVLGFDLPAVGIRGIDPPSSFANAVSIVRAIG